MKTVEAELNSLEAQLNKLMTKLAKRNQGELLSIISSARMIAGKKTSIVRNLQIEKSKELLRLYQEAIKAYTRSNSQIRVLQDKLAVALAQNGEFDIPGYRDALNEITYKPEMYIITLESVEPPQLFVNIDLKAHAGDITEYANAVRKTRVDLGLKDTPPDTASYMWKNKYYGSAREDSNSYKKYKQNNSKTGKAKAKSARRAAYYTLSYWNTMRLRLNNCKPGHAPYWHLVNYGNHENWTGDRGGKAYPITPPTKFKERAESQIKKELLEQFNMVRKSVDVWYANLLKRLDAIVLRVKEIIIAAEDLMKMATPKGQEKLVKDILKGRFPAQVSKIELMDFSKFIKDVRSGKVLGDARGRVSLGGMRFGTKNLVKIISGIK